MKADHRQFSLALSLSAGANLLLFFSIAWSMAVTTGLAGKTTRNNRLLPPSPASSPPDVITFIAAQDPEALQSPSRLMINSPDDQPDDPPTDPATRFISSTNLKAASGEAASPDGIPGLATQQGLDKPFLDLRDSEFRDGEQTANRPPEPKDSSPAPSEVSPTRKTASVPQEKHPAAEAESNSSPPTPPEAPTLPEQSLPDASLPERSETSAPAFRDHASPTLIPAPDPSVPKFRQSAPPRPLSRIPDRLPGNSYQPGTRRSKQLGTISNKGPASVDAVATEEGRFGKLIRTAIEKGWRRRMLSLASLANPGLVEVEFEVDPKGRISNVKLANPGEANPVMQDCALSAVIEAKLPPPPPELFGELQDNLTGGRMRCSFSFLIY